MNTTDGSVPVPKFEWDTLDQFKAEKRFLDGYPPDTRTFYAPRDDVHGLLVSLLESTQNSLVLNMFGCIDERLDDIIRRKLADEQVYVQMSLDSQQASNKATQEILKRWDNDGFGNSIAIGSSAKRHAISHLKVLIRASRLLGVALMPNGLGSTTLAAGIPPLAARFLKGRITLPPRGLCGPSSMSTIVYLPSLA